LTTESLTTQNRSAGLKPPEPFESALKTSQPQVRENEENTLLRNKLFFIAVLPVVGEDSGNSVIEIFLSG